MQQQAVGEHGRTSQLWRIGRAGESAGPRASRSSKQFWSGEQFCCCSARAAWGIKHFCCCPVPLARRRLPDTSVAGHWPTRCLGHLANGGAPRQRHASTGKSRERQGASKLDCPAIDRCGRRRGRAAADEAQHGPMASLGRRPPVRHCGCGLAFRGRPRRGRGHFCCCPARAA